MTNHDAGTGGDGASPAPPDSERRRELRDRPLTGSIQIEGGTCEINDWSSSGLSARGYTGHLAPGDRAPVSVSIATKNHVFRFACDFILIRADSASGQIAGVFAGLARDDRVAIASHFEGVEDAADQRLRDAITSRR